MGTIPPRDRDRSNGWQMKVNDRPTPFEDGDSVLDALMRAGRAPSGVICAAGDCPNCLATIDGVSYQRLCQVAATESLEVETFPAEGTPSLPATGTPPPRTGITHSVVDVVVIGAGRSGSEEMIRLDDGKSSISTLDSRNGTEVVGIYPGPVVVARSDRGITRYRSREVVVATGSADVVPVVPGSHLMGILTPSAVDHFARLGIELNGLVTVGFSPSNLDHTRIEGDLVRFEGDARVDAVVTEVGGVETRHQCRYVSVDLGRYPRDLLARMGEPGEVRVVGSAAEPGTIPPVPPSGVVCPCSGVTVDDLEFVWERGFRELELVKRATLAGTGTCQGSVCSPYLRSFVEQRGGRLQPTFTARPPARQLTIAEAAAGHHPPVTQRTSLHEVHLQHGAHMERMGGWWRPWSYGDLAGEYQAVREGVSLGDVSTLGKFLVDGHDAVKFLEQIYPCRVGDLEPGRSRYALVLSESGAVMDDGLIARISETRFALTFTSGGATVAEAWLRDWAEAFGTDVRIMDVTHSLAAINVTGPLATRMLELAGLDDPPPFMRHRQERVAGVNCTIYRLSFTGEISYELHHLPSQSEELWAALSRAGRALDVRPHGLEALFLLRLEKGHIIVGMDTEPDSDPRRLGMNWAVDMSKHEFVGRGALARTADLALDKRLIGMTTDAEPPLDGDPVFDGDEIVGYVTTAGWSPSLGTSVMLAWVRLDSSGAVPGALTVAGSQARPSKLPFYDPGGTHAKD